MQAARAAQASEVLLVRGGATIMPQFRKLVLRPTKELVDGRRKWSSLDGALGRHRPVVYDRVSGAGIPLPGLS